MFAASTHTRLSTFRLTSCGTDSVDPSRGSGSCKCHRQCRQNSAQQRIRGHSKISYYLVKMHCLKQSLIVWIFFFCRSWRKTYHIRAPIWQHRLSRRLSITWRNSENMFLSRYWQRWGWVWGERAARENEQDKHYPQSSGFQKHRAKQSWWYWT